MPAEEELAALRRELDDVRDKLHDVRAEQQRRNQELVKTLRAFGLAGEQIEGAVRRGMNHGLTRRAALLGIVASVGGAGYLVGTETAQAAPTGQMGTAADPIDIIYADEIGQSGDEITSIFTDSVDAGTVTADELDTALEDGSDLSGSRSFDTTYQNTTGHLLEISVNITNNTAGQDLGAILYVQEASSGIESTDNEIDVVELTSINGNTEQTVNALVPNQHHYRVRDLGGGDQVIKRWFERGFST